MPHCLCRSVCEQAQLQQLRWMRERQPTSFPVRRQSFSSSSVSVCHRNTQIIQTKSAHQAVTRCKMSRSSTFHNKLVPQYNTPHYSTIPVTMLRGLGALAPNFSACVYHSMYAIYWVRFTEFSANPLDCDLWIKIDINLAHLTEVSAIPLNIVCFMTLCLADLEAYFTIA